MFDCVNVEMRELLPELAAGTLDTSTRPRVEAHVIECAECASELETLRLVRAAFAAAPAVDTTRIVAALPKPPATMPSRVAAPPRGGRWMDWRVAAALTMITVGGLSVAVTQRIQMTRRVPGVDTTAIQVSDATVARPSPAPLTGVGGSDTGAATKGTTLAPVQVARAELRFGGGSVSELDDASLEALLGALDEIDRGPVAPSAEPDGSPVLPVIREDGR